MDNEERSADMQVFSKRLEMLLKENNLSQRELAEIVGVTDISMSRYVRGDRIPHAPIVQNIANYFGVTGEYLLGFTDFRPVGKNMTLDEYQELAARTMNHFLTDEETLEHARTCLPAEVGELLEIRQKELQGHDRDEEHEKRELGDILWPIAEYATARGWSLGEIAAKNIEKLRARYPQGFDAEHSIHRAEGDV